MAVMIAIDGSEGEGGGQVLRTALAASLVTGTPFRIRNIRAQRARPGLLSQHLTAVRAAQAVSHARVEGDALGSGDLTFEPGSVRGGRYEFSVSTAGSAILVAQTVLLPLLLADCPSVLVCEGGTHNPASPPFEFFDGAYLPLLRRMGGAIAASLERPGFYPAGGGRFSVTIEPLKHMAPLDLLDRGECRLRRAEAIVSNLPLAIAERELRTVCELLGFSEGETVARAESRAIGPGNVLIVSFGFDHVTEVFTGFGARPVRAETVAARTAENAKRYLAARGAAVGPHLADQLLLPLAVAGSGSFTTLRPSLHAETNANIIMRFLPVRIMMTPAGDRVWHVGVEPR